MKITPRWFFLFCLWLLQLALVAAFDYYSGHEVRVGALYMLPVAFAAWYLGKFWGLFSAVACAALTLWAEKAAGKIYSSVSIEIANTASRLLIFSFSHFSVTYFRKTIDLAHRRLKAFEGTLPVCCNCNRIDQSDGFWTDFPTFLRNNTPAQIEFRTCPVCCSAKSE